MERSGMLNPTCTETVPRYGTKLRNRFELGRKTPQLLKHGVGCWAFSRLYILKSDSS